MEIQTIERPGIIDAAEFTATAPYRVDPFKGANNGEVSRQWASRPADQRFLDLTSMRDHLARRADNTRDIVLSSRRVEFIAPEDPADMQDTHKLAIGLPGGELFGPTHWAFGQLCGLVNFSRTEMRKLPTQIIAPAMSYLMARRPIDDVKVFAYGDEMRAATGPKYGWIKDADVVAAVQQIAGNGTGDARWKIPGVLDWTTNLYDPFSPVTRDSTTLYASDRDVFCFLVDDTHPIEVGKLKDGSPDLMFRGFFVSNSEVGAGALRIATFYLRAVCMNRNIWGCEHFNELVIRHTSSAPERFVEEARPALLSFANASDKTLVDGVAKAKAAVVAKEEAEALSFLRNKGFSAKRAKEIAALDAEAGGLRDDGDFPRTVWDMSQSITAFARGIPNTDARLEVEKVAGALLDKVAA